MASAVVKSNNPSFSNNPWIVAQRRKKKKFSLGSRDAEIPVTEDDDDNGYIPTRSASFNTPRNNSQYNRGPTSPTLRYSKTSDQPVQAGTHGRSKNSNSIHTMGKNNNNSNDENKSSKKTIHYTNGRKNTDSDLSIEEKRRLKQNIIKKQREKHEKVSTKDDKNKFVYSSVPKASHSANDPARNGNNRKNTKTSDRGPNRGRTKSSTNRYSTNPRVHSPLRTGTTPTGTSDSEYKSDSESLASSSMNSLNSTNTPTPSSPAISSSSKKSKNLKSGNKTSGARGRTRSKSFKLGNYSPAAPILAAGGLSTHDYNPDNAFMDTTRNSREKNKNENENKNKNKKENNNNNTGNRYSKTRSPVSGATTPKKHVLSSLTMEEYTNLQAQKNTEIRSKNEAKAKARSKWPPVKTNNNYSRTGSSRNINNSGARKNSNTNNKNNTNNTSSNKQADSNARKNSNNNNDNSNNNSNNSNNSSNNNNEKKEEEFKYQLTRPMGFSQYQNQFRKHGSGQNVLPSKDKQRSSVSMATIKANPFKIQGVDTDTNNNSKNVRYEMENDNKVGRMSNKQINAAFRKPLKSLESIKLPKYNAPIPRVLIELKRRLRDCGGFKQKMIFHVAVKSTQQHHVIAVLIKSWFSELPQPLLSVVDPKVIDQARTIQLLPGVVKQIPEPNQSVLLFLWDLLADVVEATQSNRMTSQSLAQAFGPLMTDINGQQLKKQKRATFQALFASRVIVFVKRGIEWRLSIRN